MGPFMHIRGGGAAIQNVECARQCYLYFPRSRSNGLSNTSRVYDITCCLRLAPVQQILSPSSPALRIDLNRLSEGWKSVESVESVESAMFSPHPSLNLAETSTIAIQLRNFTVRSTLLVIGYDITRSQ
jgi:hypothetical protein